jgi:hypothetical protein
VRGALTVALEAWPVLDLALDAGVAVAALFCAVLGAVLLHEAGHAVAAVAVGARRVRVQLAWRAFQLHADLPGGRARHAVFFAAGVVANALGAVLGVTAGSGALGHGALAFAAANALSVIVNLVPRGQSDGARLLALRAGHAVAVEDGARRAERATCARGAGSA